MPNYSRKSSFRYNPRTKVCYRVLYFLGFPAYRVGDDGSIWSRLRWTKKGQAKNTAPTYYLGDTWKRMKPWKYGNRGYLGITLRNPRRGTKRVFYLHELVLLAFVGSRSGRMECRHFPDRDPKNNRLENLSWGTHSENSSDKRFHGTNNRGERNSRSKLTEEDVRRIRTLFASGQCSKKDLAKTYNVTTDAIHMIVSYQRWRYIS